MSVEDGGGDGARARRLAMETASPVLQDALLQLGICDRLAVRLRRTSQRLQAATALLGIVATLLALLHEEIGHAWLHWLVVALPILISALMAVSVRRADGPRLVRVRAAAASIESEIYRYRTRTGAYAHEALRDSELGQRVADTTAALFEMRLPIASQVPPAPEPWDDRMGALDADGYLEARVASRLGSYHARVRRLARRRTRLQLVSIAAMSAGAIVAAAGADPWVALAIVIAVAAQGALASQRIDATIAGYSQAASQLDALRRGWAAAESEARTADRFSALVDRAEAVITQELGRWRATAEPLAPALGRPSMWAGIQMNEPSRTTRLARSGMTLLARAADRLLGQPLIAFAIVAAAVAAWLWWLLRDTRNALAAAVVVGLLALLALAQSLRLYQDRHSLGYETVSLDHDFEFLRLDGSLVRHRAQMTVRFLHDTASVVRSGLTQQVAVEHVSTSGGRVVDRTESGGRTWVLLSLGALRRRGEQATLELTRTLRDAFPRPKEQLVVESTEHPRSIEVRVRFPRERPGRAISVTRTTRTGLKSEIPFELSAGESVVTFRPRRPREDSRYTIEWEWPALTVELSHPPSLSEFAGVLAAHLEENGLVVSAAADEKVAEARVAVVLLEGATMDPSDARRAAVQAELRPVLAVVVGQGPPLAELDAVSTVRVSAEREDWAQDCVRVRRRLWGDADEDDAPSVVPTTAEAREAADELRRRADEARQRASEDTKERLEREREELAEALVSASDVPTRARLAYSLAIVSRRLGDLEDARRGFADAADGFEKTFGRGDGQLADATFNLAIVTAELGQTADAERLLRRALKVGTGAFGPDHPKVRVFRTELERVRAERS